jgi:hypothetical protein
MANGFTFNLPQVPISQGVSQQEFQPLQFNLPLNTFAGSPLQFQPRPVMNVPSTHPEFIGQGILSGAESISKGVAAAVKSKQDSDRQEAKDKLDEKRLNLQEKQEEARVEQMKAQTALINARADGSLPSGRTSKEYTGWATPRTTPRAAVGTPPTPTTQLPDDFYLFNRDAKPISEGIEGKSLSGLVLPTPDMVADTKTDPWGSLQSIATADISTPEGRAGMGVSTGAMPVPTKSSTAPNLLPFTNFGTRLGNAINAPSQAAQATSQTDSMPEIREFPPTPQGYEAALQEAKRKYPGYLPDPQVSEGKHGGYKVNWVSEQDPKHVAAQNQQSYRNFIEGIRAEGLIKSEVQNTVNSQVYKNYTGPNGLQGVLPRAFIDTEQAKLHPDEAATADQALIDLYVRAQTGTVPREAQVHLLQSGMSLRDKAILLGVKFKGDSALLAPGQREMMERVIAKDAKSLATRVNKDAIEPLRDTVKNTVKQLMGREVDEKELPQRMVVPELRDEFVAERDQLKAQYLQASAQYSALRKDPSKRESAQQLAQQIDDLKKRIYYVDKRLTDSKGYILNMPEIENTPQGAVGRYAIGVGQGGASGASGGVNPMLGGMMIAPPPAYYEPPAPDGSSN